MKIFNYFVVFCKVGNKREREREFRLSYWKKEKKKILRLIKGLE